MQALLFLTHGLDERIVARYEAIEIPDSWNRLLLLDADRIKAYRERADAVTFTREKLHRSGFPHVGGSLTPGNNHLPVLDFICSHPEYDYVWSMEYDVTFSGNWAFFFGAMASQADFLTAEVRSFHQDRHWPWWPTLRGPERWQLDTQRAPLPRTASFNPLYRLSRRGATTLRQLIQDGWRGHHEVLMPTLLRYCGLSVEDFGKAPSGSGIHGRWYGSRTYGPNHSNFSFGGSSRPGVLFHPVK